MRHGSQDSNETDEAFDAAAKDFQAAESAGGLRRLFARFRRWRAGRSRETLVVRRTSEILFIEAIQIANQRGWARFSQALAIHRRRAHSEITSEVLGRSVMASEVEQVRLKLTALRDHATKVMLVESDSAEESTFGPDLATKLLDDFAEAAEGLPEELRAAIDEALVFRHRRFVVLGKEPDEQVKRWPPRPIQDEPVHTHAFVGLALSGGGIRSASFAVGSLEALARKGLLRAFDMVSSVSGGGYAAGWMGAWAYRSRDGLAGVEDGLRPTDGITRAPLRWLRRHCAYLAPRRASLMSGDLWALLTAYLTRWLPILSLVASWLIALLMIPHALVAAAQTIAGSTVLARDGWVTLVLGVAAALALAQMSLLRRLTMYHRVPVATPRSSPGLVVVVTGGAIAVTTLIASCIPLVLSRLEEAGKTAGAPSTWLVFGAIWVGLVFLSSLMGALLAHPVAQSFIDGLRRMVLRQRLVSSGPLVRHNIPTSRRLLASSAGVAVGTALLVLIFDLRIFHGLSFASTVTLGPAVLFAVFGLAELSSSAIVAPYLRERDRAWAARVGGWMFAGVAGVSLLFGLSLWSNPVTLANVHPVGAVGVVIGATGVAIALWRFSGLTALANATLALLALWLLSALVVEPIVQSVRGDPGLQIAGAATTLALTAFLLGRMLDVNRFTLHGIYKEGLVRTFLGASRKSGRHPDVGPASGASPEERAQFEPRRSDPATNIDDDDDPALAWLRSRPGRSLPLFMFNAAVNGRSATDMDGQVPREWPFIFSPYFCGSPAVGIGYSDTASFFSEAIEVGEKPGITLGTAMAVSGAAMSPVSGRLTRPVTAFLKALFNARLGLWIGNPCHPHAVRSRRPTPGGTALLREMLGIRTRFDRWIHLSDGGHFENLGLHELLRRGCRRIVVVDASCDPKFHLSDLAEAFRRARIDLGVHIHRTQAWDESRPRGRRQPWVWFEVDYGDDLPRGRLLYVKPSLGLQRPLPVEVLNYWRESPAFPHESTADQFFSEAQMEAYRLLGRACMEEALSAALGVGADEAAKQDQDPALMALLLREWR